MFCRNCGKELLEGETRCRECGTEAHEHPSARKGLFFTGKALRTSYRAVIIQLLLLIHLLGVGYLLVIPEYTWVVINASMVGRQIYVVFTVGLMLFLFLIYLGAAIRILRKAGKKGWQVFVPVYNVYCFLDLADDEGYCLTFPLLVYVCIASCVAFWPSLFLLKYLTYVIFAAAIVEMILVARALYGLAKHYGHGDQYAFVSLLLPGLAFLMIGWDGRLACDTVIIRKRRIKRLINTLIWSIGSIAGFIAALFIWGNLFTQVFPAVQDAIQSWKKQAGYQMEYQPESDTIPADSNTVEQLLDNVVNVFEYEITGGNSQPIISQPMTCAICNGTGMQYIPNLYYDGIMGWQGGYIGCSGCGGRGYF